MTLDLSRAIRAAVDLGDDAPPAFDLGPVTARVRRRRRVRAGVHAGIGVAAAGAVALTANQLTQPTSLAGLPAARPGAAAGECGSKISEFAHPAQAGAGLLPATATQPEDQQVVPPTGGDLGTSIASWLEVQVVEHTAVPQQQIPEPSTPDPDVRLYVVHDGTVVANDAAGAQRAVSISYDPVQSTADSVIIQRLVSCAHDGARLPAATYQVYVGYGGSSPASAPVSVAGPWTLTVAHPRALTGLPHGFPRALPLIGGRIESARALTGGGWVVNVATDATDATTAAGELLASVATDAATWLTTPYGRTVDATASDVPVELADGSSWTVQVKPNRTYDGDPLLSYVVTPGITDDDAGS